MARGQLYGGPQAVARPLSPLDLSAQPTGYRLWKSKARAYLMGRCPQLGKVLDWAERQVDPITAERQPGAAHLIWEYGVAEVSAIVFTAVQETISDQLRMTLPDLAGDGDGVRAVTLVGPRACSSRAASGPARVPEALGLPEALPGCR